MKLAIMKMYKGKASGLDEMLINILRVMKKLKILQ